jgi:hypothetical protein
VGLASDGKPLMICTTPAKIMAAIKHRQQQQEGQQQGFGLLEHSGEELQVVLSELLEDVEDYDKHVFSHLSPLERYGRTVI